MLTVLSRVAWPGTSGEGSVCGSGVCFFFSSRRRHTRLQGDWSSDVCSSDLFPSNASGENTMMTENGGIAEVTEAAERMAIIPPLSRENKSFNHRARRVSQDRKSVV